MSYQRFVPDAREIIEKRKGRNGPEKLQSNLKFRAAKFSTAEITLKTMDDDDISGLVFICNSTKKANFLQTKAFEMPWDKKYLLEHVFPGMKLFLFESDKRQLFGVYEAGKLLPRSEQCWVPFGIVDDSPPLEEVNFKDAILDNYYNDDQFRLNLTFSQVSKLLHLFKLSREHQVGDAAPVSKALHYNIQQWKDDDSSSDFREASAYPAYRENPALQSNDDWISSQNTDTNWKEHWKSSSDSVPVSTVNTRLRNREEVRNREELRDREEQELRAREELWSSDQMGGSRENVYLQNRDELWNDQIAASTENLRLQSRDDEPQPQWKNQMVYQKPRSLSGSECHHRDGHWKDQVDSRCQICLRSGAATTVAKESCRCEAKHFFSGNYYNDDSYQNRMADYDAPLSQEMFNGYEADPDGFPDPQDGLFADKDTGMHHEFMLGSNFVRSNVTRRGDPQEKWLTGIGAGTGIAGGTGAGTGITGTGTTGITGAGTDSIRARVGRLIRNERVGCERVEVGERYNMSSNTMPPGNSDYNVSYQCPAHEYLRVPSESNSAKQVWNYHDEVAPSTTTRSNCSKTDRNNCMRSEQAMDSFVRKDRNVENVNSRGSYLHQYEHCDAENATEMPVIVSTCNSCCCCVRNASCSAGIMKANKESDIRCGQMKVAVYPMRQPPPPTASTTTTKASICPLLAPPSAATATATAKATKAKMISTSIMKKDGEKESVFKRLRQPVSKRISIQQPATTSTSLDLSTLKLTTALPLFTSRKPPRRTSKRNNDDGGGSGGGGGGGGGCGDEFRVDYKRRSARMNNVMTSSDSEQQKRRKINRPVTWIPVEE